jgi:hypothetical protein
MEDAGLLWEQEAGCAVDGDAERASFPRPAHAKGKRQRTKTVTKLHLIDRKGLSLRAKADALNLRKSLTTMKIHERHGARVDYFYAVGLGIVRLSVFCPY